MEPILKEFSENLSNKNVSIEIAQQICESVKESLKDTKTASFTTVKQTLEEALLESIERILTPKKNIDILKEALSCKMSCAIIKLSLVKMWQSGRFLTENKEDFETLMYYDF